MGQGEVKNTDRGLKRVEDSQKENKSKSRFQVDQRVNANELTEFEYLPTSELYYPFSSKECIRS